jgi:hypothetical protein
MPNVRMTVYASYFFCWAVYPDHQFVDEVLVARHAILLKEP